MEKIRAVKEQGNVAFRGKNISDAITCYEECLMLTKFRKSDIEKEQPNLTDEEKVEVEKQNSELE